MFDRRAPLKIYRTPPPRCPPCSSVSGGPVLTSPFASTVHPSSCPLCPSERAIVHLTIQGQSPGANLPSLPPFLSSFHNLSLSHTVCHQIWPLLLLNIFWLCPLPCCFFPRAPPKAYILPLWSSSFWSGLLASH